MEKLSTTILRESLRTYNPVIDRILTEIQPRLDQMIQWHKEDAIKEGKPFTARDEEYLELAYTSKLIESVGSYLKKTDDIEKMYFRSTQVGFIIEGQVTRDEIKYNFATDAIIAGGYNIQRKHYRYITKTNLPSHHNQDFVKIQDRISKMKMEDRLRKNIQENEDKIIQYKERIVKNEAKLSTDNYAQYDIKYCYQWIKECDKKRPKLQAKLDEHLAQINQKPYEPQEGDYKVIRSKDKWVSNPISVYKFTNGNWKHVRSTSMKNIASAGLKLSPSKDEDVITYHKYKLL